MQHSAFFCLLYSSVLLFQTAFSTPIFFRRRLLQLLLFFSFFGRPPPKQPSIADTKRIHLNKPFIWLLLNNLILLPSCSFFLMLLSLFSLLVFWPDTVMHFHLHSQFIRLFSVSVLYARYSLLPPLLQWCLRRFLFRISLSLLSRCTDAKEWMWKKSATALHDIQRGAFTNLSLSLFIRCVLLDTLNLQTKPFVYASTASDDEWSKEHNATPTITVKKNQVAFYWEEAKKKEINKLNGQTHTRGHQYRGTTATTTENNPFTVEWTQKWSRIIKTANKLTHIHFGWFERRRLKLQMHLNFNDPKTQARFFVSFLVLKKILTDIGNGMKWKVKGKKQMRKCMLNHFDSFHWPNQTSTENIQLNCMHACLQINKNKLV